MTIVFVCSGFGVVFLAKNGSEFYALKRIVVNSEVDFLVAEKELKILVSVCRKIGKLCKKVF